MKGKCEHVVPMSENTIRAAIRSIGFGADKMTASGFHHMASTILNESGLWSAARRRGQDEAPPSLAFNPPAYVWHRFSGGVACACMCLNLKAVMGPHADDFYRFARLVHFVDRAVFEVDAPGVCSQHLANQFLIWRRGLKRGGPENFYKDKRLAVQSGRF